jgi:hypothetical protein
VRPGPDHGRDSENHWQQTSGGRRQVEPLPEISEDGRPKKNVPGGFREVGALRLAARRCAGGIASGSITGPQCHARCRLRRFDQKTETRKQIRSGLGRCGSGRAAAAMTRTAVVVGGLKTGLRAGCLRLRHLVMAGHLGLSIRGH